MSDIGGIFSENKKGLLGRVGGIPEAVLKDGLNSVCEAALSGPGLIKGMATRDHGKILDSALGLADGAHMLSNPLGSVAGIAVGTASRELGITGGITDRMRKWASNNGINVPDIGGNDRSCLKEVRKSFGKASHGSVPSEEDMIAISPKAARALQLRPGGGLF